MQRPRQKQDQRPSAIGYVLTHYPRVTQTFIRHEIEALRDSGVDVYPMAINPPQGRDAADPEADITLVLKRAGVRRVLTALAEAIRRRPLAVSWALARAVASGGGLGPRTIKRLGHVGEALVVWDHGRRHDLGHLHAHFGQTPSTIAMFAAEFGRLTGTGASRYSFSVHCASEMHDTAWTLTRSKVDTAAVVVCVSDHTRSHLMWRTPPQDWHRLQVVRCGIDLDRFALRQLSPVSRPTRVVVVGRLAAAKGHLVLLDAVHRLAQRNVDIALEIIGGGDLESEIRSRIDELGLGSRVSLAGEIDPAEVGARLRQADVFCLPSFDEGLPMVIMEAMAIGVPVLTTFVAGIPELARNEETALVVPAGNADALALALQRLCSDDELRERLVVGGRAAVERLHDERDTLPAFMAAIGYSEQRAS